MAKRFVVCFEANLRDLWPDGEEAPEDATPEQLADRLWEHGPVRRLVLERRLEVRIAEAGSENCITGVSLG